jgi:hypothetical protein
VHQHEEITTAPGQSQGLSSRAENNIQIGEKSIDFFNAFSFLFIAFVLYFTCPV